MNANCSTIPEFWTLGILTLGHSQTPSKRSLLEVGRKSAKLYQIDKQTHDGPECLQIPEFWSPGISTCGHPHVAINIFVISRFKNRDSTCRDQHVAHMPIVEHSACMHTCQLLNILHACQLLNILHVCTGPYWGHLEVMLDFLLSPQRGPSHGELVFCHCFATLLLCYPAALLKGNRGVM